MTDQQFIDVLNAPKPFAVYLSAGYPIYQQPGSIVVKQDASGNKTLWKCKANGNYSYGDIVEGDNWEKIDLPATF